MTRYLTSHLEKAMAAVLAPSSARRAIAATLFAAFTLPVLADEAAHGRTARFEVEFMRFTIDHHFSALRATELAAGTDAQRDADISPTEGTSPTPGFAATPAKSSLPDMKSLARRANRMQREEILTLQGFLQDWYGIQYHPRLSDESRAMLARLERARPGADFDRLFMQTFSQHHYELMEPVNACMTGTDLEHFELRRECQSMWHGQIAEIDMLRHELKRHFNVADFQPFKGLEPLRGSHGGHRGHGGRGH